MRKITKTLWIIDGVLLVLLVVVLVATRAPFGYVSPKQVHMFLQVIGGLIGGIVIDLLWIVIEEQVYKRRAKRA